VCILFAIDLTALLIGGVDLPKSYDKERPDLFLWLLLFCCHGLPY